MSACRSCVAKVASIKYQEAHPRTRQRHLCKADSLRWNKAKRDKRTKEAIYLRDDEFNLFVLSEIHSLRRKRNDLTGIDWHVDHIIPLQNKLVCGLHYYNNLRVIPASLNRRKSNALHGERQEIV